MLGTRQCTHLQAKISVARAMPATGTKSVATLVALNAVELARLCIPNLIVPILSSLPTTIPIPALGILTDSRTVATSPSTTHGAPRARLLSPTPPELQAAI